MLESIIQTLIIMGWLGIVFFILVAVNTICGILFNLSNGEVFSKRKLAKGLIKALVFYLSSVFTAIAFTLLPSINNLIIKTFGVALLSSELLNILSSIAVLAIVVAAIVTQGKKALEGIKKLSDISSDVEEITWEVEEPTEEDEEIEYLNEEEDEENGIN